MRKVKGMSTENDASTAPEMPEGTFEVPLAAWELGLSNDAMRFLIYWLSYQGREVPDYDVIDAQAGLSASYGVHARIELGICGFEDHDPMALFRDEDRIAAAKKALSDRRFELDIDRLALAARLERKRERDAKRDAKGGR